MTNKSCTICGGAAKLFGEAKVLRRHRARYFRCESCGFVRADEPVWLAEAYSEALSSLDVGAVSRNLRGACLAGAVIRRFFEQDGRFVDYGAGAGLFVRLMRDAGFDFRWADKFATNVFAKGFEAESGSGKHEMLTAFEVFEHLEDPVAELERMLAWSRNILFSTVLLPPDAPGPGKWWYYGLEHGQHVAFYTPAALRALAERFGLWTCSAGELHLLSARPVSAWQFRFVTRPRVARWINRLKRRSSLTGADYQILSQKHS
jgi:hypothetical protein